MNQNVKSSLLGVSRNNGDIEEYLEEIQEIKTRNNEEKDEYNKKKNVFRIKARNVGRNNQSTRLSGI